MGQTVHTDATVFLRLKILFLRPRSGSCNSESQLAKRGNIVTDSSFIFCFKILALYSITEESSN